MTEATGHAHWIEAGWSILEDDGFVGLIGPFLQRGTNREPHFAFPTDARHRNLRGVLQGGALMTFADRSMGMTARAHSGATRSATLQLDVQFIDAVQLGELVETRPRVLRATRSTAFVTATLTVGERVVGSANGLWRYLSDRSAPETTGRSAPGG